MRMYLSIPRVCVATKESQLLVESNAELNEYYRKNYSKLFDIFPLEREGNIEVLKAPRIGEGADREKLVAQALAPLLEGWGKERNNIDRLFDCTSMSTINGPSPVYRIAKMHDLIYCTPIMVGGLGGTELAYSLRLLDGDRNAENAIFILSQIVNNLDFPTEENGYVRGDASAALIVSKTANNRCFAFAVVKVETYQTDKNKNEKQNIIGRLIESNDIDWIMLDTATASYFCESEIILDSVIVIKRNSLADIDFGCVDIFITLNEILKTDLKKISGRGMLISTGRYGSISGIIVETLIDKN